MLSGLLAESWSQCLKKRQPWGWDAVEVELLAAALDFSTGSAIPTRNNRLLRSLDDDRAEVRAANDISGRKLPEETALNDFKLYYRSLPFTPVAQAAWVLWRLPPAWTPVTPAEWIAATSLAPILMWSLNFIACGADAASFLNGKGRRRMTW